MFRNIAIDALALTVLVCVGGIIWIVTSPPKPAKKPRRSRAHLRVVRSA